MKLNKKKALLEDKCWFLRVATWCERHDSKIQNCYFDDPLANANGIYLTVFVKADMTNDRMIRVLREARAERDVTDHQFIICPDAWFDEVSCQFKESLSEAV